MKIVLEDQSSKYYSQYTIDMQKKYSDILTEYLPGFLEEMSRYGFKLARSETEEVEIRVFALSHKDMNFSKKDLPYEVRTSLKQGHGKNFNSLYNKDIAELFKLYDKQFKQKKKLEWKKREIYKFLFHVFVAYTDINESREKND